MQKQIWQFCKQLNPFFQAYVQAHLLYRIYLNSGHRAVLFFLFLQSRSGDHLQELVTVVVDDLTSCWDCSCAALLAISCVVAKESPVWLGQSALQSLH
uniref:Uncharacterized protein n=1 Tax=Arundo donax TaxID=35708 RepID=A0A0A9GD65_ARUDO